MNAQEHSKSIRFLVHEFNNLLFVIGGHCELLSQGLGPDSQAQADLAAISEAADRAASLTAQMRALAIAHAEAAGSTSSADADRH